MKRILLACAILAPGIAFAAMHPTPSSDDIIVKDEKGRLWEWKGWVPAEPDDTHKPPPPPVKPPPPPPPPPPPSGKHPAMIDDTFLKANFHMTFNDTFMSLDSIALDSTFVPSKKWFNGVEQCCLSPTPQPGAVGGANFPTSVDGHASHNPYSLIPGGGLGITLFDDRGTNGHFNTVFSGVLTSVAGDGQGFTQEFGFFEAEMKVPPNVGVWPAFWLLGGNTEIDIIEFYGHDHLHYWGTVSNHATQPDGINRTPMEFPIGGEDLTTTYHKYALLWDADEISFYLDRKLMKTLPVPAGVNRPVHVLVDLGAGGGWPTKVWPDQDSSPASSLADLNNAMLAVKSIEVWQHN